MTTAKYVTFKTYAGFVARGVDPVRVSDIDPTLHMQRAAYLTAQLEAGAFGTVQSYDGVAMSGGLLHNIAVPHDGTQGSFFTLLARVKTASPSAFEPVRFAFAQKGWRLAEDGSLRDAAGHVVIGETIRAEFTGPKGLTPPEGAQHENAKRWALLFNALFMDTHTHRAQIDYAIEWLVAGNRVGENRLYRKFVMIDNPISMPVTALPKEVDFVMCVYHSFSANAPGIATGVLEHAVFAAQGSTGLDVERFARELIRGLGLSNYGRWHDEPGTGGNRYDRTRVAAERSGIWPADLVHRLMPTDLHA